MIMEQAFWKSNILICILLFNFTMITYASAQDSEFKQLATYKEDVTGDGMKETIEVKGIPLSDVYYKDIKIVVTTDDGKSWEIPYQGGYQPSLKIIDLNHDQISDLYFQSLIDQDKEMYKHYVHSLKNGKRTEIKLPSHQGANGKFIDDFNIEIQIVPHSKPIVIDISNRSEDYIRLNIYNHEGTLLKESPLTIDPIAFYEPVFISRSKGYGLKSHQYISEGNQSDHLGTIETLWYYENNQWIILQTKWIASS